MISEKKVSTHESASQTQPEMNEIPDMSDSPPQPSTSDPSGAIANLSLDDRGDEVREEEIPDIDDIPDMDDEGAGLEEEDDAAVRIVHPSA